MRFGSREIRDVLGGPAAKPSGRRLFSNPAAKNASKDLPKDGVDALVGRGEELAQMRLGLERTSDGQPCCLHVIGESGMG